MKHILSGRSAYLEQVECEQLVIPEKILFISLWIRILIALITILLKEKGLKGNLESSSENCSTAQFSNK